jgi:signal transduction histidine kinase
MSQTALRAQRAAADFSYPTAARQEFAAIESTAADSLHELRLVLRALRNKDENTDRASITGLGAVVLDLEESVRAVADDLSASGYSVTYQCRGDGHYTRLQAAILSRVLREMTSNVLRHADHDRPVTITLSQDTNKARLVVTNGVFSPHHRLPSSGMGILGMQERLSTIGGSLNTLIDNGTWLASASIPLSQSATRVIEDES